MGLWAMAWLMASGLWSQGEFPVRPYVDPSHLEMPWPKHSHYRQPWRAFLETRSGFDFLQGIGINYNLPPGNDETAVGLLAEMGMKTFRIEVGWGSVNWEETALQNAERLHRLLSLCRRYSIRPTLLLNAHHGVPCPVRFFQQRLREDAPQGSRTVRLEGVKEVVPGRTGLSNLTEYKAAQVFITAVNPGTGECSLSRPLPKALKAGEPVLLATLKYLPAHPVGTQEFEEMAQGWVRYARLVCQAARRAGLKEFDVEIWNELSFGSAFMGTHGINHYYDPPLVKFTADFLRPGGHAWEVARRTIEMVKKEFPGVRCIWGFSNTTFFHTPIEELPPGTDGQSYHPYGTGTRRLPEQEQALNEPQRCLEGFVPRIEIRMPEGWAHTFIQTESLMRLLNPQSRLTRRPKGVERFYHYMTEHGVAPPECGVTDAEGAWRLKAKTALRAYCLWLNKGIDVLHYFCAYGPQPTDMGLLPENVLKVPWGRIPFEEVATLPMKAVRNLVRAFQGAKPLREVQPLEVDVVALGEQRKVFEGGEQHPPLWEREMFAFLPFQLDEGRFAIGVYVMTFDATKEMPEARYRLTLSPLPATHFHARLYDPLEDRIWLLAVEEGQGSLRVEVPVRDYPRLLLLDGER